jgi:pyruvate dehydrogenase E1 component alpha subunit
MRTSIADRAKGFGVRSWSISADDPDSTYLACLEARRYVETSASPGLIELQTTRIGGHTTTDPHASYREPDELSAAISNDPVVKYRDTLVALGVIDNEWLDAVDTEVATARQGLIEAFAS